MHMPPPDAEVLQRRGAIIAGLQSILPGDGVIHTADLLRVFESDGLTAYAQMPLAAVLPETVEQVAQLLRFCSERDVKIVPRGAGTSLSGGALPLADGVLMVMSRFNRILEIDLANRCAVVQPGVTNLAISKAVEEDGFYYAPDPSSQIACSIGGNVAENAGGVHCLKYGLTTHNILGVQLVLMSGETIRLGGKTLDAGGYDLLGIVTGSEGLLGVVTEVTVRLLPRPTVARAALIGFSTVADGARCVAEIIATGIIPAGLEMMDRLAISAAEAFAQAGYPVDVEALLIVEVDGHPAECAELLVAIEAIARQSGASSVHIARNDAERARIWAGRKAAFPAVAVIGPDYYCVDGTIPRSALPAVLQRTAILAAQYNLRVANVFHAGDGNLHPMILYDNSIPGDLQRAEMLGGEILRHCVEVGGVLTGEHGVGVEKRDLMPIMFDEVDLAHQQRLKCAFDPQMLLNPGKVFPVLRRCAELGRMHVHRGKLPFPELDRL
jgi:glycolate oxidase